EYATPIVRKLAAEKGVDLSKVHGTGVGGRIRKQDVLDAASNISDQSQPPAAPVAPEVSPTPPAPADVTPPASPVPTVPAVLDSPVPPARVTPEVPAPPVPVTDTPRAAAPSGDLDMARLAQLFAEVAEAFAHKDATPVPPAPAESA
ncbi:E3 binding domain-containing protein, partial [Mobiluncus curtisii]